MHLKENAGKYSVGAIVLVVIATLMQLNIFVLKSDLYRDFVTKDDFNQTQEKIERKLDYISSRLDTLLREK